jgi:drug/metabolite transporter (DMT)-like permease
MSVVAPVSALAAAVLPVAVGVLRGERLEPEVLLGVLLCLVAIALVSMEEPAAASEPGPDARRLFDSGPLMAGISGLCFGGFFILLNEAGDGAGLWPLVAARVGNMLVIGTAMLVLARVHGGLAGPPVAGRVLIGLVLLSGTLDASANALYFVAAQEGMLSLAAVLASLYPAITVLLARIAYSERLRVVQRVGMAVAAVGVALVTVG